RGRNVQIGTASGRLTAGKHVVYYASATTSNVRGQRGNCIGEGAMTEPQQLAALPEDWDRALAVVAHPDDLEYGDACTVARWTSQGKQVHYLLVTRGEAGIDDMPPEEVGPLREIEEHRSAAEVGVSRVEFLAYPDGVVTYRLPLRRDIARAMRRYRPNVVIT